MPLNDLAEQLRLYDRDRFFVLMLAPEELRPALVALYGFNLEISRIPETVSEEMIGYIRYAWWREALDELYAGQEGRAHEVVQALAPIISQTKVKRETFEHILDARQQQFSNNGFETFQEFIDYCEATSSSLLYLCLQAAGVLDSDIYEQARHIGIAYAILGHLRALPFHASKQQVYLPEDVLIKHRLDREILYSGQPTPALCGAVKELVGQVVVTKADHVLLKPYVALVEHYIWRFKKTGYDPYHPRLEQGRSFLALKILFS